MPFTYPLDPATPADGNYLREGDDRIREIKAAIRERLSTIFTDPDSNPLTFIAGIIVTAALADNAVTAAKLADLSVDTAALIDAAVTNTKIAGVDGSKITDNTITSAKLQDALITLSKLADGAVNTIKIADLAITTAKIALLAVTGAQIANDTIDDNKLFPHLRGTLLKQNFVDQNILTFSLATNTSWDSPDIAIGGAIDTDIVLVTPKGSQAVLWAAAMKLITYVGFISAPGVGKIRLQNNTGGPVTIPTSDWRIMAIRRYADWYP